MASISKIIVRVYDMQDGSIVNFGYPISKREAKDFVKTCNGRKAFKDIKAYIGEEPVHIRKKGKFCWQKRA